MSTYEVMDANRKIKRDIQKVFGDDFLKIITEILLNSDDSYNRMRGKKRKTFGQIQVKLNRRTRVLRFLDHAEGMSLEEMRDIFRLYGGDYSKAINHDQVRGLFGQGASDVLFLSAFHQFPSYIISIKDSKASKCSFIFDDKKHIYMQELLNLDKVRKETGIGANGTLVVFGLPESVKIPRSKDIKEKIEAFYMLRSMLTNPSREVSFFDGELKHRLNASSFLFTQEPLLLRKKKISFSFDEEVVTGYLTIHQVDVDDPRMILIKDEHGVIYEESLFGLEKVHGAKKLAGYFLLEGVSNILRRYLNKEKPEEILRDSRDGFDRRHRFTISMVKEVSQELMRLIESTSGKEKEGFSLKQNPYMVEALKSANRYFDGLSLSPIYEISDQMLSEDRLKFAREQISITKGKRYGLHLYVNPLYINEEETITLKMDDNPYVSLSKKQVSLQELNQSDHGLLIKHVVIKANKLTKEPITLRAKMGEEESTVLIRVVDLDVFYPENGLSFSQKKKSIQTKSKATMSIYFDTSVIPLKSSVLITMHYESMLFPESLEIYTTKNHLITDTIGRIKFPIHTHDYEEKIALSASSYDIITKATCVVKKDSEEDALEGLIKHIELVFEDGYFQTKMDTDGQTLLINGQHPINQRNLVDLDHKDPKNPIFNEEELSYLYELIALESSKHYVMQKHENDVEVNSIGHLLDEIQEHKSKLYKLLFRKE